jgi:hypothetical protein
MNAPDDRRLVERVAREYAREAPIDPAARARLDEAIARERPPRRRVVGFPSWRVHPALAAAALLATLGGGIVIGRAWRSPAPAPSQRPAATADRVVQFVLVAPSASSVALVGDFNDWDAAATPMRRAPDGESWTVSLPVPDGLHAYAFVVDGSHWMADPVAPLAPGDGFGFRSSVLLVGARI